MTLPTRPLLLPAVLTAVALCAPTFLAQGAPPISGKVIDVHDADTYTVAVKVRLHYVDAPELKQPHGKDAAQYARDILLGRTIQFVPVNRSYDRTVADVSLNGLDVALLLTESGHVMLDPRYNPPKELLDAQAEAKAERVGLWGHKGDNGDSEPIEPRLWRRGKRK